MGILNSKYVIAAAFLLIPFQHCRAEDPSESAEKMPAPAAISAEDQAKVDAVIEAAKQSVEEPAVEKSEPKVPAVEHAAVVEGSSDPKADVDVSAPAGEKAVATISSSGEKITLDAAKPESGKAVVTLTPEKPKAEKKGEPKVAVKAEPKKTAVAKAAPAKKFTPVVAKLPPPRAPKTIAVAKALPAKKPAVTTAKAPAVKTDSSVKRVRAEIQKPLRSVTPLSAFELGRYQYCGDDRDCAVAVNGCCDCANGGEDVAVNKDRFQAFRSRFACLNVACGEKSMEPSCASGVVSCVNHKCRYFSDAALEEKF